jgi:hemerythrin-like metal-binding protein
MTVSELIEATSRDHDELSSLVERLRSAVDMGRFESIRLLLIQLHVVEARHYASEDALMRAVGYDDADAHRADHLAMLDTLTTINQTLAFENLKTISRQIVAHLESTLAHMIDADRKLGRFVAANSA